MHGDHPSRIQIEEGASCVARAGVNVAKLRRIISADREQCYLRRQAHADLAEAGKICSISRVIHRMLAITQHVSAIAAMGIAQYPCSPMPGWHVRNGYVSVAITVPPVQLDDIAKAQV